MYKQSVWKKYNGNYKEIMDFAEDYKDFISFGKTERLCVKKTLQILEEKGFVDSYRFYFKFFIYLFRITTV